MLALLFHDSVQAKLDFKILGQQCTHIKADFARLSGLYVNRKVNTRNLNTVTVDNGYLKKFMNAVGWMDQNITETMDTGGGGDGLVVADNGALSNRWPHRLAQAQPQLRYNDGASFHIFSHKGGLLQEWEGSRAWHVQPLPPSNVRRSGHLQRRRDPTATVQAKKTSDDGVEKKPMSSVAVHQHYASLDDHDGLSDPSAVTMLLANGVVLSMLMAIMLGCKARAARRRLSSQRHVPLNK